MKRPAGTRHAVLLAGLAAGMFGFAFALVPLYNVFCEITGLNGKTSAVAAETSPAIVSGNRSVTISFLATVARGTPWEFHPAEAMTTVRPGEMHKTTFLIRNRAATAVTAQAVPSVSPGQAAQYLKKLDCFCFEQQELAAGGEAQIGVSFYVDAGLPPDINELTLSYTMFRVDAREQVATND